MIMGTLNEEYEICHDGKGYYLNDTFENRETKRYITLGGLFQAKKKGTLVWLDKGESNEK